MVWLITKYIHGGDNGMNSRTKHLQIGYVCFGLMVSSKPKWWLGSTGTEYPLSKRVTPGMASTPSISMLSRVVQSSSTRGDIIQFIATESPELNKNNE